MEDCIYILHACIQLSISVPMWNVHAENGAFHHLYHLWAARCFPLRYDGDIQRSSYSKKAGASSWLREDTEWSSLILSLCIPCVPCNPCIPRMPFAHHETISIQKRMACTAMTISVTYLPARAKVCHAMAHDRNCMMQRTSTLWNVMVSTAIEGPGRPVLCTFCKYVKKRKNFYV